VAGRVSHPWDSCAFVNLFSLVMTARANGLEPFEYLCEVFEQLPLATTVEAIEALLPWNLRSVLDARRERQKTAPQIAVTGGSDSVER
jgi:hypothetical protein